MVPVSVICCVRINITAALLCVLYFTAVEAVLIWTTLYTVDLYTVAFKTI